MEEKKTVVIGLTAYNLPRETEALIRSCVSEKYDVVIDVHQNTRRNAELTKLGERVLEENRAAALEGRQGEYGNILWSFHEKNRGLAASWNDTLIRGYGGEEYDAAVVILVNDDIEFREGDIDKIADYALAHPDKYMITVNGYNDHPTLQTWTGLGFSCFAVNRIGWETLGCFDENFVPIYFEDCDYGRRGYLAGLQMDEVKTTRVFHHGSLHWQVDKAAHDQNTGEGPANQANAAYFRKKWQNLPGVKGPDGNDLPMYDFPFGEDFPLEVYPCSGIGKSIKAGVPKRPYYISPANRHAPYGPGFDRTDIDEVVKI